MSVKRKRPSLSGRGAQVEMLAEAMFWWAWGNGYQKARRAEKDDYRKSARAFLRSRHR